MSVGEAALDEAMESRDVSSVVALFARATEEERRSLAPHALRWERRADESHFEEIRQLGSEGRADAPRLRGCARAAVMATASWGEIRKRGHHALPSPNHALAVLRGRRPAWIESWARWVLPQEVSVQALWWPCLRELERSGLIARPETPHYWTAMASSLAQRRRLGALEDTAEESTWASMGECLLADPGLLEEHVWVMLEHEEAVVQMLAEAYTWPGGPDRTGSRWDLALASLARESRLSRSRLLDAALDGLWRSTKRSVRWFGELLQSLDPSEDEQAQRSERLLRLASAPTAPAAEAGLDGIGRLVHSARVPARALAEHVGPALATLSKTQALKALRLFILAARNEPAAEAALARAAMTAFDHSSGDVHARAIDLLEGCAAPALAEILPELRRSREGGAASQRQRLSALTGDVAEAPAANADSEQGWSELQSQTQQLPDRLRDWAGLDSAWAFARGERKTLPAVPLEEVLVPRLDPGRALTPIDDLDRLIDTFLAGLEGGITGDEAELLLDGLLRLPAERAADFGRRTAALLQRAQDLLRINREQFYDHPFDQSPPLDLALLALAWVEGNRQLAVPVESSRAVIRFRTRLSKIERRLVRRQPTVLLSTPTHAGGWIDPHVVPERWLAARRLSDEPDLEEQALALLRLAPDGRLEARASAQVVEGEFGAALRYALGGDEEVGETGPLWVAAARARAPRQDDPAVRDRHPSLVCAATYQVEVREFPTGPRQRLHAREVVERPLQSRVLERGQLLHDADIWLDPSPLAGSWTASVWPAVPDGFFAEEINRLAYGLDAQNPNWSGQWDPLFDPDTPATPVACSLVMMGLSARHSGMRQLALDGLIALIGDGRVDGARLGQVVRQLLPTSVVTHSRWLRAFREAAKVSALHVYVLWEALADAVGALAPTPPARATGMLEALHELTVDAEQALGPETRAHLQAFTSGKAGKLAAALRDRAAHPASRVRQEAGRLAIVSRLERARRYQTRLSKPAAGKESTP